jgi:MerR family transcriptional regulator, copper efflux regulator
MPKLDEYLHITEAARYVGVCINTLRNWEAAGKLRVYRNPLNRYRLYKVTDLDVLAMTCRRRARRVPIAAPDACRVGGVGKSFRDKRTKLCHFQANCSRFAKLRHPAQPGSGMCRPSGEDRFPRVVDAIASVAAAGDGGARN